MRFLATIFGLLLASPAMSAGNEPFFIDLEAIAAIALEAVHEAHPEVVPDDLSFEKPIFFTCPLPEQMARQSAESENSTCTARVTFTLEPSVAEIKYVNVDGECRIAQQYEQLRVSVFPDGTSSVRDRRRNFNTRSVNNCTEDLYDLPQCTENPLINPDSCNADPR